MASEKSLVRRVTEKGLRSSIDAIPIVGIAWRMRRPIGAAALAGALVIPSALAWQKADLDYAKAQYMAMREGSGLSLDGSLLPNVDITSEAIANLDFSKFDFDVSLNKYTPSGAIEIASVESTQTVDVPTGHDISTRVEVEALGIKLKSFNLPLDFTDHRILEDAQIRFQYFLPPEAIETVTIGDFTDVRIDKEKLEIESYYPNAESMQSYTPNEDGTRNFEERRGWSERLAENVAGVQDFFGYTELVNKIEDNKITSEDMIIDTALYATTEACKNKLDDLNLQTIKDKYTSLAVNDFGLDPNQFQITFVGDDIIWNPHYDDHDIAQANHIEGSGDKSIGTLVSDINMTLPTEQQIRDQISCDVSNLVIEEGER